MNCLVPLWCRWYLLHLSGLFLNSAKLFLPHDLLYVFLYKMQKNLLAVLNHIE